MKIYGDVLSPFVRMSLVVAHEAGLGDRLEHVKESVKPTEVNQRLAALSPIGKVPVLETDHHHAIYDSRVIMEYLAHVAGNRTLIPDEGVKRFRILTMLALGQGLADTAVAYRYETAARPQGLQWHDWMARTRQRIDAIVSDLNGKWAAEFGLVHAGTVATAVALSYIDFRLPDLQWRSGNQALADFHKAFSERASMQATRLG
jgi:glutathione S-transferase